MNLRMTGYIIGLLLAFEGAFMAVPTLTAAIYREPQLFLFALTALLCLLAGFLITRFKPQNKTLFARDGFFIVALSWIVLSVVGALPFWISGCIPRFVDALFESVSGFTTTGASILHTLEGMPKCMLMWRSFTHWVGGMGVLVFIMALLPVAGGQNMYLMKAESPGPSVSKLVPRVKKTAMLLYVIYFVMTVAELVLLLIGGMPLFDAINIAVATAGTGGFSCNPAGMPYSPFCINVITVFMFLFGVNFSCYYLMLHRRFKESFTAELKVYLGIIAFAIITITLNVRHLPMFRGTGEALMHSSFTIGSLLSSTGFATVDFNQWPEYSRTLLVMLMFVGACAGSTGGGIKVSRIIILFKNMHNELRIMTHPRQVKTLKMDGHPVDQEIIRSVNVYLACFFLIYAVNMLVLSFDQLDLTTNFTATVATLNNIGPGLNMVGPTSNFDVYSTASKCMLIFNMLAGRLELFPIVLLFSPATWKK
ncbi:MAG: TrkH family potassium uptake protein [Oscillospiraceae bacterium]|nr:TrkH family potassium uptake protein [Oscillospiraceae bacterium]